MLNQEEEKQLIPLLEKLEFPISLELFRTVMKTFVSVPIDLAILNDKNEILLIERTDAEYTGLHIPGTVLLNNESVSDALKRLEEKEIIGLHISEPKSIDIWTEVARGTGEGENKTRHEISLLHLSRTVGNNTTSYQFYDMNNLPNTVLSHHKKIIHKLSEVISNNTTI